MKTPKYKYQLAMDKMDNIVGTRMCTDSFLSGQYKRVSVLIDLLDMTNLSRLDHSLRTSAFTGIGAIESVGNLTLTTSFESYIGLYKKLLQEEFQKEGVEVFLVKKDLLYLYKIDDSTKVSRMVGVVSNMLSQNAIPSRKMFSDLDEEIRKVGKIVGLKLIQRLHEINNEGALMLKMTSSIKKDGLEVFRAVHSIRANSITMNISIGDGAAVEDYEKSLGEIIDIYQSYLYPNEDFFKLTKELNLLFRQSIKEKPLGLTILTESRKIMNALAVSQ